VARAATQHHRLCEGDTAGEGMLMSTDAEALLNAGIELAKGAWPRFREELSFPEKPKRVITHQVGRAHTQALFGALGLELASTQLTYDRLGNVGSVSLPITLALAVEAGFIARGDEVALLGIGSGLSTVFLGVRW
jgi:3-oxoacyl-[acyl-carrier-protein] synthase-3